MKKIVIFSRDPGGTYAVLPLVDILSEKYCTSVYAKDTAVDIYQRENIPIVPVRVIGEYTQIEEIIRKEQPDLVITGTSADDFCEKYLWKSCQEMNIPTFAVLDHWCNYGIRFSRYTSAEYAEYKLHNSHDYMPDKILTMDEYSKCKLMEEKIPEDRIEIVGQPHFEWLVRKAQAYANKGVEAEPKDIIRVLYVSEPYEMIYGGRARAVSALGYSEKTVFEELLKSVERVALFCTKPIELVIKLHPKESRGAYDKYLEQKSTAIRYEQRNNIWEFASEMDIICGMTSMFLLEAYVLGRSIISIQIGGNDTQRFILEELGEMKCVRTAQELDEKIRKYILESPTVNGDFFVGNACKRILKLVEEYI